MSDADQASRYRREYVLGQGGFATTWLVTDTRDGRQCALKELHLQQLGSWKDLENFEREISVLRFLDHPGIPRLVDAWNSEAPPTAVLVQAFVQGRTLQQWVEEGRRFTEAEVIGLASQLAGILSYLHGFTNPVIHRDLKPSNVMLDPQGQIHLIDFGGVARSLTKQGTTVTGTFGYMPLEQIEGRAVPASDLYALGATLVFLLCSQPPADLPKKGLRPDFRQAAQLSPAFAKILDKLLEPEVAKRYLSAAKLHADLLQLTSAGKPAANRSQKPAGMPWTGLEAWARMGLGKLGLPLMVLILLLAGLLAMALLPGRGSRPPHVVQPSQLALQSDTPSWRPALPGWKNLVPAPAITALTADAKAQVWGLSDKRLYRFRGDLAESWQRPDANATLLRQSFLVSPAGGEVWFGTRGGKLFRWRNGQAQDMQLSDQLSALTVWQGQIVAAIGAQIWAIRPGAASFTAIASLPENPKRTDEQGLFSADGSLWASVKGNLYRYQQGDWSKVVQDKGLESHIFSLAATPQSLWLGRQKGLIEINRQQNTLRHISAEGAIQAQLVRPDKSLWMVLAKPLLAIGASEDPHGLGRWNGQKWQYLGWREGLPDDRFQALLENAGTLWLSGAGGELWRAPVTAVEQALAQPQRALIPALRFDDACQAWQGLKPGNTPNLAADTQSGSLSVYWHRQQMCPAGDGYRRDDGAVLSKTSEGLELRAKGRITRLPLPEKYLSIQSLMLAQNGDIWLSRTYPYVVDHFSQGHWQKPIELSSQYAPTLIQTAQGDLLAATKVGPQLAMQRFQGASRPWLRTNLTEEASMLPPNLALLKHPQLKADLALATSNGLYLVDAKGQDLRQVQNLPYKDIDSVAEDSQGRLWIIYLRYDRGRGLSVWDSATGSVRHLDSRQGLVPDRIKDLAFDSQGRLWLEDSDDHVSVYAVAKLEAAMKPVGQPGQ